MDITEFFLNDGERQEIYCNNYHTHMLLSYEEFDNEVTGVHIKIENLPILRCMACGYKTYPERSRVAVIHIHQAAFNTGLSSVTHKKIKITNGFKDFDSDTVKFIYDTDDYYYIPGLARSHDSGFLTPIFFKKNILIKYQNDPEYKVQFASRTYGSIWRSEEYAISFGINRNGLILMWLGDIKELPDTEQYFLRSENVPSDHDVGSEFYDAQIDVQFTDYPPEDKLMRARTGFLDAVQKRFNAKIDFLSTETLDSIAKLSPPIHGTDKEAADIANLLNQIILESLEPKKIKQLLKQRNIAQGQGGSLKSLELLLAHEYPDENIANILSPFFVLYDLLLMHLHAGSKDGKSQKWASICTRMNSNWNTTFIDLYSILINKLQSSYAQLSQLLKR